MFDKIKKSAKKAVEGVIPFSIIFDSYIEPIMKDIGFEKAQIKECKKALDNAFKKHELSFTDFEEFLSPSNPNQAYNNELINNLYQLLNAKNIAPQDMVFTLKALLEYYDNNPDKITDIKTEHKFPDFLYKLTNFDMVSEYKAFYQTLLTTLKNDDKEALLKLSNSSIFKISNEASNREKYPLLNNNYNVFIIGFINEFLADKNIGFINKKIDEREIILENLIKRYYQEKLVDKKVDTATKSMQKSQVYT